MNILYISYDGMTDPLGQSQVIPYLKGLSQKGHQISIISCEKSERFRSGNTLIQNLLDSNNIKWHPVSYSTLPSVLSKQLNLFLIKRKAEQICQKQKIDIVHCRSYMAALIGLKLKYRFGLKFIFDMRGFWADERVDGKIWNLQKGLHNQIFKYFKKKEIEFLKNADYTICLTENAKKEILSWEQFKNNSIPIEVIPCCADLDLFSVNNINQGKKAELKNELNITSDDFIISYLGSIGTWYMLDEMLDFFKCLLIQKSNAKFLFITPDNKELIIQKAIEKSIETNKLIIRSANRNEVPLYLSLSHVSLYFIKPLYSKKASSPTKTGEILAMGIPVITNSGIGDSDSMIEESGSGLIINSFTINEYNRIIDQIDVILNKDKSCFIDTSHKYFSLEKGIDLYYSVYKELE